MNCSIPGCFAQVFQGFRGIKSLLNFLKSFMAFADASTKLYKLFTEPKMFRISLSLIVDSELCNAKLSGCAWQCMYVAWGFNSRSEP